MVVVDMQYGCGRCSQVPYQATYSWYKVYAWGTEARNTILGVVFNTSEGEGTTKGSDDNCAFALQLRPEPPNINDSARLEFVTPNPYCDTDTQARKKNSTRSLRCTIKHAYIPRQIPVH